MNNRKIKPAQISKKPIQHGKKIKKSGMFSNINATVILILILVVTFVVYFKTFKHDFTNWDDDIYIHANPYIKNLNFEAVKLIFTKSYFGNYHPLTTLTYAIEYSISGENPFIYHFNNVLLHLLNTFLVFLLIRKLTSRIEIPLISAFIFALHPLHVESVAWISERKDVLYTFFFLASLLTYIKYLNNYKSYKYLVFAFLLFLASLMSKSAAVVLPLVMLLTLYYINRRLIIRDIVQLMPFFALSVLFGIIALKTQVEAIGDLNSMYVGINRIFIVTYGLYFYIINFFVPHNLSALHAFPPLDNGSLPLVFYISPVIIAALIVIAFISKNEFKRHFIFGILFFLINVVLIIQIFPVGQAVVAERYTYVPYIGLAFVLGHAIILLEKHISKLTIYVVLIVLSFIYIFITWQQTKVWENSETLWSKTIEVYAENQIAYNNRGLFRDKTNNHKGAYNDFSSLIEINPNYKDVYNNRATSCFKMADYDCTINDLDSAIARNKDDKKLYNNRGLAKFNAKDFMGAIADYSKAIEIDSMYIDPYTNRSNVNEHLGNFEASLKDLGYVIKHDPKAVYYNMRGVIYGRMQVFDMALNDFDKAIDLDSGASEYYFNKGNALLSLGNKDEACKHWKKSKDMGNKSAGNWIDGYCR